MTLQIALLCLLLYSTSAQNLCFNGGSLIENKCQCTENYRGLDCSVINCGVGGRLHSEKNECVCNEGYGGPFCQWICQNGMLYEDSWCQCYKGWTGDHCDESPEDRDKKYGWILGGIIFGCCVLLGVLCLALNYVATKYRRNQEQKLKNLSFGPPRSKNGGSTVESGTGNIAYVDTENVKF